jgi:UDP-N-acetylglucosamine--N-acetylmuramyl-(pentapeptide) pyrophosphoryl-undecaprenol N-acetylglucosamine transferase
MRRIPLVLMESNAYPGLVTRRLAARASEIHVAFEAARKHFGNSSKVFVSGNPIRSVFSENFDRNEARLHFGLDPDRPVIFAFGGSLGARSINSALDDSLERLRSAGIQVIWQTGTSYSGSERKEPGLYRTTFLNEMHLGYAAADLVVARAGATTISEVTAVGKPSVLVPLPIETVRQRENAEAMEELGASEMIRDAALSEKLYPTVVRLLADPERLRLMGEQARKAAVLNADEQIAHHVLALAGVKNGRGEVSQNV